MAIKKPWEWIDSKQEIPYLGTQKVTQEKVWEVMDAETLPIMKQRKEIEKMILENQTSIIIWQTWSGKTTCLPLLINELIWEGKKIAITQPRVLAATSVAEFVAWKLNTKLWDKVGYQVRFDNQTDQYNTRINFMTEWVLLWKIHNDTLLEQYSCVVLDEAHERSLNIDFLLWMLKNIQKQRKEKWLEELKLIVTSATIEKEKFMKYFSDSPSIEAPWRQYEVKLEYREPTYNESYDDRWRQLRDEEIAVNSATNTIDEIITSWETWDILVFLPWKGEIEKLISNLKERNIDDCELIPLYSEVPKEEQQKIYNKTTKRKIIVSTNIAETSLTIPWIKIVIDSWLIKQTDFDWETWIEKLHTTMHSKAWCKQRAWRAGRTWPWKCIRLYGEWNFERRDEFQKPEILRTDLSHTILLMKKFDIVDIEHFDFIDKPDSDSIKFAISNLISLWALDKNRNITELWIEMTKYPLTPKLSRMLIEAQKYDACEEIATISAFLWLGGKSVFYYPKKDDRNYNDALNAHNKFNTTDGDFIRLLNIYREYEQASDQKQFCLDNFLNQKTLTEVGKIRYDLLKALRQNNIYPATWKASVENIKKAIVSWMIWNLLIRNHGDWFEKIKEEPTSRVGLGYGYSEKSYKLHNSSSLKYSYSKLIVCNELKNIWVDVAIWCQEVTIEDIKDFAPDLIKSKTINWNVHPDEAWELIANVSYNFNDDNIVTVEEKLTLEDAKNYIIKEFCQESSYYSSVLEMEDIWVCNSCYKKTWDNRFDFKEKIYWVLIEKLKWYSFNNIFDIRNIVRDNNIQITLEELWISKELIDEIKKKFPDEIEIKNWIFWKNEKVSVEYKKELWELIAIVRPTFRLKNEIKIWDLKVYYWRDNYNYFYSFEEYNQNYDRNEISIKEYEERRKIEKIKSEYLAKFKPLNYSKYSDNTNDLEELKRNQELVWEEILYFKKITKNLHILEINWEKLEFWLIYWDDDGKYTLIESEYYSERHIKNGWYWMEQKLVDINLKISEIEQEIRQKENALKKEEERQRKLEVEKAKKEQEDKETIQRIEDFKKDNDEVINSLYDFYDPLELYITTMVWEKQKEYINILDSIIEQIDKIWNSEQLDIITNYLQSKLKEFEFEAQKKNSFKDYTIPELSDDIF